MKNLSLKKQLTRFAGTSMIAVASLFSYGVWISGNIEHQEIANSKKIRQEQKTKIFAAQVEQTERTYQDRRVARIQKDSRKITSN